MVSNSVPRWSAYLALGNSHFYLIFIFSHRFNFNLFDESDIILAFPALIIYKINPAKNQRLKDRKPWARRTKFSLSKRKLLLKRKPVLLFVRRFSSMSKTCRLNWKEMNMTARHYISWR